MNKANEKLYQDRLNRIQKAIRLEPVEQIPSIYMGLAFSPRYMGMTVHEFCTNPDAAVEVTLAAMKRLGDLDGLNMMPGGYQTLGLSMLWLSKVLIPGIDLDENALWQVHEKEIMSVEDYDVILDQGWEAFRDSLLPRIMDMDLLQANLDWFRTKGAGVAAKFQEAGFVAMAGSATAVPFEPLCGARSMPKFFLDLYRMPDKVQAVMDVVLPSMVQDGIKGARGSGVSGIWLGGWRTASAMLAPKLWDRFAFPHFIQIANKLVEKGYTPILHLDQDWTRDLERFRELPARKCVVNPDGMTDIRKIKEQLGDHMAIMGDVPSSLFAAGTPEDIRNYIRDLVRDVGPNGLLLCPGCDAPINTRPENMEAFVAAAREFG